MGRMPKTGRVNKAEEYSAYESVTGPYWTRSVTDKAKIIKSELGVSTMDSNTVIEIFKKVCEKKGKKPALCTEVGVELVDNKPPPATDLKTWKTWTFQQYYDESRLAGLGYMALGLERYDSVNIFGFNSPEWFMSQMGCMMAGGVSAGLYPTDTPEQIEFKSNHSNCAIASCENQVNMNKFKEIIDQLPYLKAIIVWNGEPAGDDITRSDGSVVKTLTWVELCALGAEQDGAAMDTVQEGMDAADCAAYVYTSGTTGNPKAVMISHDSIVFECASVLGCLEETGFCRGGEERILSYLPLSHVAGMMVDVTCTLVGSYLYKGYAKVCFARAYDLKIGTIGDRLRTVRPTIFLGVPRVWEKIAEKLKAIGATTKGLKKKISTFAKGKSLARELEQQLGGSGSTPFMYGLASKILKKIKAALGLDQCKFHFTGAAPITQETLNYFGSLGININEVYGMSENTGACTWNNDPRHLWGTVGWEMPGVELKIFKVDPSDVNNKTECPLSDDVFNSSEEEQGEICWRGRNNMMGYMANPKMGEEHVALIEKKNMEAIDNEGWLHSGDKGCKGKNGCVKITGRFKELIITAGGENIAPVPIEDGVKLRCPAVSNIMMVGDKRKFNVAIIALKCVGATGEQPGTDELDGAAAGMGPKTIQEACDDEAYIQMIQDAITKTNEEVAPSNAAKIQRFTILPEDFSVSGGDLTATLKLKRSVVAKRHENAIEAIYATNSTFVAYKA